MVTTLEDIKDKAILILKEAGITRAGVFGSFARGEQGPEGDVDILYKFGTRVSLLRVVALGRMLSELLERKVDMVSEGGSAPILRNVC